MKKRFIAFYVAAFCIVVGLSFAMPVSSAILFYEDFEDALKTDPPNRDWRYSTHGTGSQELTTEQVRAGSSAYKFSCTGSAIDYVRQEITLYHAINDGTLYFGIGKEYWIGFSIFLADGYYSPSGPGIWGVNHHQYHDQKDVPPKCEFEELSRKPPLTIRATGGKWNSWVRWDPIACSLNPAGWDFYTYDSFITGQWTDFVINVKWSYNTDGFLKIWKDGVLITDRTGGNCYNDDKGPFLKIGIYGRINNGQIITIYYDELRIGDENSSYSEVAPGGSVKLLPPTNVDAK